MPYLSGPSRLPGCNAAERVAFGNEDSQKLLFIKLRRYEQEGWGYVSRDPKVLILRLGNVESARSPRTETSRGGSAP